MTDELLPYYNDELDFIRNLGAEFAEAHPEIAGHLRLSKDHIEDPHVSRLIESFAYLNARTRKKIDDDFPEISRAFLNVLYPHFLAPFPPAAIARFDLDSDRADATTGHEIPVGTPLEAHDCHFRTCYPVQIWPLKVSLATLRGYPTTVPENRYQRDDGSVVRIQLSSFSEKVPVSSLTMETLRFFIRGTDAFQLHEMLFNELDGVVIASSPNSEDGIHLGSDIVQTVGFARDEGIVDYDARSFIGYRLLSEFFAFPEKFLFFDVHLGRDALARIESDKFELYFFLGKSPGGLENRVDEKTFQLGCTPIVNLFSPPSPESFNVDHTVFRHRLVPDSRRRNMYEIYSVDSVRATDPKGQRIDFAPFYSTQHSPRHKGIADGNAYWYAERETTGQVKSATEMYLSLVDLDFKPKERLDDWTLEIETTCFNRDLSDRLLWQQDMPLAISEGGAAVQDSQAICISPPTEVLRHDGRRGASWKLISHLNLNHLSLVDTKRGAEALREILMLYDLKNTEATRKFRDAMSKLEYEHVVRPVTSARRAGHHGFCRGIKATLTIDDATLSDKKVFLFSLVMERFFGLYTSINSFTQTYVRSTLRKGYLRKRVPPLYAGDRQLLAPLENRRSSDL